MNNLEAAIPFNTLRCANRFKSVNMPEKQAEAIADELNEMINMNLATKRDLKEVETSLKTDIALVHKEIELAKKEVIIYLGSMMAGMFIIATSIIALLIKH